MGIPTFYFSFFYLLFSRSDPNLSHPPRLVLPLEETCVDINQSLSRASITHLIYIGNNQ